MNNIKTTQEKTYPTNKYFDILNKSKDSSIHSHKFTRITFEKDNSKTILNINCIEMVRLMMSQKKRITIGNRVKTI